MCSHRGISVKVGILKWQTATCSREAKYRCRRCRSKFCGIHIYKSDYCFKCADTDGAY